MKIRTILVYTLAIPYLIVMLPIWASRDFMSAFVSGLRKEK